MAGHFDRLLARAFAQERPLTVQLELTHRCNLRCSHCYLDTLHPPDELSTAEWELIISDLAQAGTLFLNLTGGELFARKDWLQLARHARARGMALTLLTSGTRLEAEQVPRIAELKPLAVELSLYSRAAPIHDRLTGVRGSHRKTLYAAARLRRAGVPVVLKCPILRSNLGEISGVQEVAERLGARFRFDPGVVAGRDRNWDPAQERPSPQELARVLVLPGLAGETGYLRPQRSASAPQCQVGRSVARIGPNGDLFACGMHPVPAGNVRQVRFQVLWERSSLLLSLRATTMSTLSTCGGCAKNDYCGRCAAMALLEHGDALGPQQAACERAEAKELATTGSAPPAGAGFRLPLLA